MAAGERRFSKTTDAPMKTPNLYSTAALGLAILASCSAPTPAMTVLRPSSASRRETSLSDQVFREVNHYRSDRSRQELRLDACLGRLAREHAKFLSANRGEHGLRGREVSHHGFTKRARTAQFTKGFVEVAENVVSCRNGNAATLVRLWSHSESHEKTMRANYQYTGVGTVVDTDGMVFSVQLFAATAHSNTGWATRLNAF